MEENMKNKKLSLLENRYIKPSSDIIKYLEEIEKLSKLYNLSISHEDCHGAFIIEEYKEENIKWLNDYLIGKEIKND